MQWRMGRSRWQSSIRLWQEFYIKKKGSDFLAAITPSASAKTPAGLVWIGVVSYPCRKVIEVVARKSELKTATLPSPKELRKREASFSRTTIKHCRSRRRI